MNLRQIAIILLIMGFISSGCSKDEFSNSPVMQEKVTLQNLGDITQKVKNEPNLTKEEIELFANGLIRLAPTKDSLVGKSVIDVIKGQKEFIRNQSVLFFERTASRVDLAINHNFHYVGFQPRDDDKQSIDILVFEITNTSDKEIKNLQGMLQFYTQDNQLLKNYNIKFDKALKPGEMQRMGNPFLHDDKNERDRAIRSSTNLKAIWNPTLIEFADGTKKQLLVAENAK